MSTAAGEAVVSRTSRLLLAMAAVAVAFAAADTYVVVLALPDMMTGVGVPIDQLQRAAPIVSGFLLGYVAMLPLIGRIADLRGRVPVLVMALVLFALGSLITTVAYDMPSIVAGRFLQGVGGGGLVPATLALVADLYPVERRGVPLGVVSAVQEIGSVLGPLFGAAVLAVADWRAIFAINLAVGLVLAAAIRALAPQRRPAGARRRPDLVGLLLLLVTFACAAVVFLRPAPLMRDLTWGRLFVPFAGDGRWLTPIGMATVVALVLLLAWCWFAPRPLLDLRGWIRVLVDADLVGALLLAAALGGVILAFATADPKIEVFSPQGRWYLLGALVAAAAFTWHVRRAAQPAGAARRAASYAGVGGAAGQLLRRCRADRRPHRHPAVRPHHRLPRRPAARGARAGPVPARAAGGRRASAATSSASSPPASSPRSACCSPRPASC